MQTVSRFVRYVWGRWWALSRALWKRKAWGQGCALLMWLVTPLVAFFTLCVGCSAFGMALGVLPDTRATETAEWNATQTRVAILALTPSATPTPTYTLTPSYTPTATFTPSKTLTPTDTLTPSMTYTPSQTFTPSKTFTPSRTPTASDTPTSTATASPTRNSTLRRRYVTSGTVNLRACAGTTGCAVVGQMKYGYSFTPWGVEEDAQGREWYMLEREGELVYVAGWLTSDERPPTPAPYVAPSGGSGGSSGSDGGGQSSSAPPVYGAAQSCLNGAFDFSVCAQYQPAPANCDEAVARGIPARVVACCFPARDRDGDGVACYGD